jgi:hypothetical protein
MPRRFPEKYRQNIETIKTLIMVRSKLLSEFGKDNISIELVDHEYNQTEDYFNELVFEIIIKNVDGDDCDFYPEQISKTILKYRDRIDKSSQFHLSDKLQISNGGGTTRGVLVNEVQFRFSEFEILSYSLFIDPSEKNN